VSHKSTIDFRMRSGSAYYFILSNINLELLLVDCIYMLFAGQILLLIIIIYYYYYLFHLGHYLHFAGLLIFRVVADPRNSGFSAKSRKIPPKNVKYHEIHQKYFQIHVGKTYLILILAIRPVFSSPQMSKFILKLRYCNE